MFEGLKDVVIDGDFEPVDKHYWKSGWKHTEESKALMSKNMKGRVPWNKGKKGLQEQTEEKREKCRIAGKKSSGGTGKRQGPESQKKRSESLKKYYAQKKLNK